MHMRCIAVCDQLRSVVCGHTRSETAMDQQIQAAVFLLERVIDLV
jgi:hypothetical protein